MRKLNSAIVIFNPKKPNARKLAHAVEGFLSASGVKLVTKGKKADLLVMVSGDGTILYNKSKYDLPIFAIGSTKSVICQAHTGNWKQKLEKIIRNGFITETRAMLSCTTGGKKIEDALNEAVLHSVDYRLMELELKIGGKLHDFSADGVLFSTPTGSTAYCYSCGGRILPASSKKYEVAAIAPYKRAFTPLIVSDALTITVRSKKPADLIIDGQRVYPLKAGTSVVVKKSKKAVELVKA